MVRICFLRLYESYIYIQVIYLHSNFAKDEVFLLSLISIRLMPFLALVIDPIPEVLDNQKRSKYGHIEKN